MRRDGFAAKTHTHAHTTTTYLSDKVSQKPSRKGSESLGSDWIFVQTVVVRVPAWKIEFSARTTPTWVLVLVLDAYRRIHLYQTIKYKTHKETNKETVSLVQRVHMGASHLGRLTFVPWKTRKQHSIHSLPVRYPHRRHQTSTRCRSKPSRHLLDILEYYCCCCCCCSHLDVACRIPQV